MSLPRTWRISRSGRLSSSCPLKWIVPEGWLAAGYGKSFMTDSAVTDWHDPDSPTSATVSPFFRSKEMRSTARIWRSPWPNATESSRTEGGVGSPRPWSPERLSRIERVAHRFADEDQEREHE